MKHETDKSVHTKGDFQKFDTENFVSDRMQKKKKQLSPQGATLKGHVKFAI